MKTILDKIDRNKVNYNSILNGSVKSISVSYSSIKVIIPIRGRDDFISPTVKSLMKAGVNHITVVEHSNKLQHHGICKELGIYYIGIPCSEQAPFNKCLAFNVGAISVGDCDWLLMHDVDCMVQPSFFLNSLNNLALKKKDVIQPFNKRRVLYCNENLTKRIIEGRAIVDNLNESNPNIFTCEGQAPGGSIFIDRDLFFDVGGYDPELFSGYSPEDKMFWDKISVYSIIVSCDRPPSEVFHLHHEFMGGTNPLFKEMLNTSERFNKLSFRDKAYIINYKSKLLDKWK